MEINIYYCVFSNSIYKYVKFKLINNIGPLYNKIFPDLK